MAHCLSRLGRGFCRLTPSLKPAGAGAALTFNHGSHSTQTAHKILSASRLDPKFHTIARSFSSTAGGGTGLNANPSYQIYGENTAFTMKCIMPGFRIVGNRTVIMETSKKGRLLLEFTPRQAHDTSKFAWDRSLKFALSAEEIGTLVARLSTLQPVEFARQTAQNSNAQYGFHGTNDDKGMGSLQKVFRAIPNSDGSIQFSVDYELDGRGGQDPPNPKESHGPMEISLMTGEFQVIKSLMEFSIPRLVGWPQMMDRPLEQLLPSDSMASPHNYSSRGDGGNGVPF